MKLLEAFTTVATDADALRLADLAVQQGLAACVQLTPVKSVYRWQGRLEHEAEIQLGFKTTEAGHDALRRAVLADHPYELPAWTALPVVASEERFAAWVADGASGTSRASTSPPLGNTPASSSAESANAARSPEQLVQEQLDAYNARDMERFCAVYADTVQFSRLPAAQPFLSGKPALREHYAKNRFNLPSLHADLLGRMLVGNKVIDHERIHGVKAEPFETVAVYECDEGLIRRVWFVDPQ